MCMSPVSRRTLAYGCSVKKPFMLISENFVTFSLHRWYLHSSDKVPPPFNVTLRAFNCGTSSVMLLVRDELYIGTELMLTTILLMDTLPRIAWISSLSLCNTNTILLISLNTKVHYFLKFNAMRVKHEMNKTKIIFRIWLRMIFGLLLLQK